LGANEINGSIRKLQFCGKMDLMGKNYWFNELLILFRWGIPSSGRH